MICLTCSTNILLRFTQFKFYWKNDFLSCGTSRISFKMSGFSSPGGHGPNANEFINIFERMSQVLFNGGPPSSQIMDDSTNINRVNEHMMNLIMLSRIQRSFREEQEEKKYFTQENKQLAEIDIKTWCKSDEISPFLIKLVAKLWTDSPTGTFPSLDSIVNYFYQRSCLCMRPYSMIEQKALIRHFLINFGRLPQCLETQACMEFYVCNRQVFPDLEAMNLTLSRMMEMMASPENFHEKDKLHVPTANLQWLEPEDIGDQKDQYCALCQDEISSNQKCFRLTPCGHIFHAQSDQCLDTCSILDWLKDHKYCPICKSEIKLQNNEKIQKE